MNDFVGTIFGFVLNILLASLLPAALAGIILKVQRRRRSYARGKEGDEQFVRDSHLLVVFFNSLYIVWVLQEWLADKATSSLRIATTIFYTYYFYARPLYVTNIPDYILGGLTWIGEVADARLEKSSTYRNWKSSILASKLSRQERMLGFSGPEIPGLKQEEQLLLTQTRFICQSCGLEKDNSHLGDIFRDEKGQLLYFCDDVPCRVKARDIYSRSLNIWRSIRRLR